MKYAVWLVVLVLALTTLACSVKNKSGSSGEGKLDINLLNTDVVSDINPLDQSVQYKTDLIIEIGNPTDNPIKYDEVQVFFESNARLITGTRCADNDQGVYCMFWYGNEPMPEYGNPISPVLLTGHIATRYSISSGTGFVLDDGSPKLIVVSVMVGGKEIASSTFDDQGNKVDAQAKRVAAKLPFLHFC